MLKLDLLGNAVVIVNDDDDVNDFLSAKSSFPSKTKNVCYSNVLHTNYQSHVQFTLKLQHYNCSQVGCLKL